MTDKEKLDALYRLYEKPLYRIAYAVLHDQMQAEDAVSEAFYRVIKRISRIGEPDSPETRQYMICVIRSTAFRQYRRNARDFERSMPWDEEMLDLPDPENALERRSLLTRLREMLGILNETDRRIVILHGQEGVPFREIAWELGMNEAAVRKRYERARKRIQKQFPERTIDT